MLGIMRAASMLQIMDVILVACKLTSDVIGISCVFCVGDGAESLE